MSTRQALESVHELARKEVSHDRVVALVIVLSPFLGLLTRAQSIVVHLLVRGLFTYSIELVVHTIDQEPHEFLRVLLAVT
jgi:hypothetical protein